MCPIILPRPSAWPEEGVVTRRRIFSFSAKRFSSFFSLSSLSRQLLGLPLSTITSLTSEQVRRSTRRTRTVLVSASNRKSSLSSPLHPSFPSLYFSLLLPQRIRVPSTFCLSNKSGRESWVSKGGNVGGIAAGRRKRGLGDARSLEVELVERKGYLLAGRSKNENNRAIK